MADKWKNFFVTVGRAPTCTVPVDDPIVWNEIGVVLYKKQDYGKANEVLKEALRLCDGVMHSTSETIVFNLAHTYRKLQ